MAPPTIVLPADRTTLGDRGDIAAILDARAAEAEEVADLIGDLETALASDDPQAALASRIAQLRKGGAPSRPYARRARELERLSKSGDAALQPEIDALRIRCGMLGRDSSMKR